jgi:acyl carrier protein
MSDSSHSELRRRVENVVARQFELSPDDMRGDIRMGNPPQWDSVGHMGLVFELENEFGITFPSFSLAEMQTVDKIVSLIEAEGGR